jgi:hypothetical protein
VSTPENLIPLTEDERQILNTKRSRARLKAPLFTILAVAMLALLFLFQTLYCLIALPLFSLLLGAKALGAFLDFRALSRDLKGGQKQIVSGPVEAQDVDVTRSTDRRGVESSASYNFWIQVKGKKLTVSEEQYYQFKKGDLVEAFIAPNSGTMFGINKEQLRRPFS